MQLEVQKYLFDIRTSIDSINDYLGESRRFDVYLTNKQLRRSVERELEIIGEAIGRILQLDAHITISNARKIISLRNRVIHAYDNVNDETVWGIVINHLPKLSEEVDELLGNKIIKK